MRSKSVALIGAPSDLGANERGSCLGPSAMRIAGLHEMLKVIGYQVSDRGDLTVPIRERVSKEHCQNKFKDIIAQICSDLYKEVQESLRVEEIPVTIGGDHSLSIGSISGVSDYFSLQNKSVGVIWFDAHADMNTPTTSPTGNIHGMPVACLLGKGEKILSNIGLQRVKLDPKKMVLIGLRSVDSEERRLCQESGVHYVTMRGVDEKGIRQVTQEALEIAGKDTAGVHVSFDIDSIDPYHAPGVSTPVTGGLSYRESHLALELIADSGKLTSIDIMELNPVNDTNLQTARLAIELLQSALGKSIV